jgi:hypothetical protein
MCSPYFWEKPNSGKNVNNIYNNKGGSAYCRYLWGTPTGGEGFIDLMPGGGSPTGTITYYYPGVGVFVSFPSEIQNNIPFTIEWLIKNENNQIITDLTASLEQSFNGSTWTRLLSDSFVRSYEDTISDSPYESVKFRIITNSQTATSSAIPIINSGEGEDPNVPYKPKVVTIGHEAEGVDDETNVTGGENVKISWDIDYQGSYISYELQWRGNSGSWETIYAGLNTSASDDIPDVYNTVQYRVRSKNTVTNTYSDWKEGNVITVYHNKRPQISGVDHSLGTFDDTPPNYSYIITDPESDTLTTTVWADGEKIVEFIPTLGFAYNYTLTDDEWKLLPNGLHVIQILTVDQLNRVANRTVTYMKGVNRIEFTCTPHYTNQIPSMLKLTFVGFIPEGSDMLVEATNNAYDDNPVWEDITQNVMYETTYNFINRHKTADNWGLNVRVRIRRLTGIGPCYIKGLIGKYTVGVPYTRIEYLEGEIEKMKDKLEELVALFYLPQS